MKKDTYAKKLAELLGIEDVKQKVDEKKKQRQGIIEGITEEEIQGFREAQGIIYFLQAPALFQFKICKECGADFLVSRLYVAYCSYTCIKLNLNKMGFEWRKGNDIETLVADPQTYNGNEPIWIRNLENLKAALEYLTSSQQESLGKQ